MGVTADVDGVYQIRISDGTVDEAYTLTLLKNALGEYTESSPRNPLALDDALTDTPLRQYAVSGMSTPVDLSEVVWGVQSASGRIVVVDPMSGDVVTSFAAPGDLLPSHVRIGLTMADVGQTLLYLNADDDPTQLYRIDPWTGEVLGTQAIDDGNYDGLAFDAGKLFLGQRDMGIARLTESGDPLIPDWTTGNLAGSLAGDDYGRIFAVLADQRIHEFDPSDDVGTEISSWPCLPVTLKVSPMMEHCSMRPRLQVNCFLWHWSPKTRLCNAKCWSKGAHFSGWLP